MCDKYNLNMWNNMSINDVRVPDAAFLACESTDSATGVCMCVSCVTFVGKMLRISRSPDRTCGINVQTIKIVWVCFKVEFRLEISNGEFARHIFNTQMRKEKKLRGSYGISTNYIDI